MENKKTEGVGFFDGISTMIKGGLEKRKQDATAIIFDAIATLVAFLFSRCHIAFGAYPLGVSFVAVLPHGVWLALLGAVVGSLTLGRSGVIHAIITIIVVFLRVIISGGDRKQDNSLFSEPLVLRMASASIGAFVGAAYEVLLGGFAFKSILYGVFSVLLSAVFTFAFAGIFDGGVSLSDVLTSRCGIFSEPKKNERERFAIYLFQATFLLFVFLISISLKGYNVLGISPAYIFSTFITLIVARRFGAIRAMTVGFVSSLGISSIYSVAFSLVGLGAGILFNAGLIYAVIGGGVLLSVWSAYAGGALGFLTTFPEYATAAMLALPILKKLDAEEKHETGEGSTENTAQDMVTATALAYKSSADPASPNLELMLSECASVLHRLGDGEGRLTVSEYKDLVIEGAKCFCRDCPCYSGCIEENPAPCIENVDAIASKLYKKERLFSDDSSITPKYCHNSASLFSEISKNAALREEERYKSRKIEAIAEEYELCSRLISESVRYSEREKKQDGALGEKIACELERVGLYKSSVKVFGERRKHFIIAGEDRDGSIVTSAEFHKAIEDAASVRLGTPEYYRKGSTALFECSAAPTYSAEFSAVGIHSGGEIISGDTAISFESADGRFYALIADGMGSGEAAHRTSHLTCDLISRMLTSPVSKSTVFNMINHIIKNRCEECSTTVDLFELDLFSGDAVFYKCGAAPSYVKRESSIFRIRSETAPLGLMKNIDAERIRVEVQSGDYVVMLSDGVSQSTDDSTWLLELLSKPALPDIREYAEYILDVAKKNCSMRDDMSVAVARINRI